MTEIGICLGTDEITESARDAERLGFESVWARDHFAGRAPMLAPEVVLATAAAVTERIRVGYGVLLAAVRPLPLLAKELASLQYVSGGGCRWGSGTGGAPGSAGTGACVTRPCGRRWVSGARTPGGARRTPCGCCRGWSG